MSSEPSPPEGSGPGPGSPSLAPRPVWRPLLVWTAGILLFAGLAWFVGAVAVPVWQTRSVVQDHFVDRGSVDEQVDRLGGREHAAARLRFYLKLPECVAPFKRQAAHLLVWGTLTDQAQVIAALHDPDECIQSCALGRLRQTLTEADTRLVPELLSALADPGLRHDAIDCLGKIGPTATDAVPALVRALDDHDGLARVGVEMALGRIGMEVRITVPALVQALRSPSPQVRAGAAHALSCIGPAARAARPALVAAAGDPDDTVRFWVRYALKSIGEDYGDWGPEISQGLASDDPMLRATAATFIREFERGDMAKADAAGKRLKKMCEEESRK